MLVSINEIQTTVYKAMSAQTISNQPMPDGICLSAAKSTCYLQTMGINVLADLLQFLARPPRAIKPITATDNRLDLHNISCIYQAQTAVLLAMAQLENNLSISLNNTCDPLFLLRCLRHQCALMLRYHDHQYHHCVFISPTESYPRAVCRMAVEAGKHTHTQLTLSLSRYSDETYQHYTNHAHEIITQAQFAQTHQQSLLNGIDVDDAIFQQLKQYAQTILVENTQASLQGAGADVNSIDPEDIPIDSSQSNTP